MSITKLKLLGFVPSLYRQVNVHLPAPSPTRTWQLQPHPHMLSRAALQGPSLSRRLSEVSPEVQQSKSAKQLFSPFIFILFIWKTRCPYVDITWGQLTNKQNHPVSQIAGQSVIGLYILFTALVKNTDSQTTLPNQNFWISGWEPRNLYF